MAKKRCKNQRFAADLLPKVLGANKRIDFERFYGRDVNVFVTDLHEFPNRFPHCRHPKGAPRAFHKGSERPRDPLKTLARPSRARSKPSRALSNYVLSVVLMGVYGRKFMDSCGNLVLGGGGSGSLVLPPKQYSL